MTTANSRRNERWNPVTGQNRTVVLRNASLFDGESILKGRFDITFSKGVVEDVSIAGRGLMSKGEKEGPLAGEEVVDVMGAWITPGLVDMHSHHLAVTWPLLGATDDTNERHDRTEPITSQVRIIGM